MKSTPAECRVYIENGQIPVHPQVTQTVNMAMETLKNAGMVTTRDDTLPIPDSLYLYTGIFRKWGNPEFKAALGGGKPYSLWFEILRTLLGMGRISARVLFFTLAIDRAGRDASKMGLDTFEKLDEMREVFLNKMGKGGILLTPIFITLPPKHGWTWRLTKNPPYTLMFNALGFPAVVVPIRYDNNTRLPLAVQVVASPGEDELCLAVAAELERVHGGWKMAQVV